MSRAWRVRLSAIVAFLLALLVGIWFVKRRESPSAPIEERTVAKEDSTAAAPSPRAPETAPRALPAPETPAPKAGAARLAGTVLRSDGTPARGWRVTLWGRRDEQGNMSPRTNFLTTEDGAFAFDGLAGDVWKILAATFDRRKSPAWEGRIEEGQAVTGIVLKLPPLTDFAVTVVDVHGAGIEGASVRVTDLPEVVTGPEGVARLEIEDLGQVVTVVEPPQGGPRRFIRAVHWSYGKSAVRIVLPDAAIVSGVVVAPDGSPAPGIPIATKHNWEVLAESASGPDGRFEICVPVDEAVLIEARARFGGVWWTPPGGEKRRVRGEVRGVRGGDHDVRLELEEIPAGLALDVVVLAPDGRPVEGAAVLVYEQRSDGRHRGSTDLNGRVRFEGLEDVPYSVSAEPPASAAGAGWIPGFCPAEWYPGDEPCEVQLVQGLRVRGLVARPDGSPARGATLSCDRGVFEVMPSRNGVIPLDAEGRFDVVVHPSVAIDITFTATADDGALRVEKRFDAREVKGDLVLQLVRKE